MKKSYFYICPLLGILLVCVIFVILIGPSNLFQKEKKKDTSSVNKRKTQAIMLMIEFEGTEGLVNFVDNIKERDIPGILVVNADFVEENCDEIKSILSYHDIEIAGLEPTRPLWDVSYDEQLRVVKDTKDRIYNCTGKSIRIFGSKYFAYDENTLKAAQENGIEYVFARGTTGAKATVYEVEEYDVKIFSVSNVDSQNWGTGSLCDYSYWAREGTPDDFEKELFGALKYDKISPVSHTYIGGLKKSWNDVYLKFLDEKSISWVDMDTFGKPDVRLPLVDIPVNREVKYDTPHPAVPLDMEEDVKNPCLIEDVTTDTSSALDMKDDELIIFHNNTGSMCLEALQFLKEKGYKYTEYISSQDDFNVAMSKYKGSFTESEGFSKNFGYYPIIFVEGRAFSGFNGVVQSAIEQMMDD